MSCNKITQTLDDYLDGQVGADAASAVDAHVSGCRDCRAILDREMQIRAALRRLPAPEATDAFFERALAQAVIHDQRRHRWWMVSGTALAASIALALGFSILIKPDAPMVRDIPGLSIALNETREVSLVFESELNMDNAQFTVQLPAGVELAGYPGQREIHWEGRLIAGKNLLVLPVEARSGQGGDLIAHVTHAGKSKNFSLKMEILPPAAHTELPVPAPKQLTVM